MEIKSCPVLAFSNDFEDLKRVEQLLKEVNVKEAVNKPQ
jgi:hypothetical protein